MMNVIQEIANKRQQLLDGLEANEGDINLRIFEDFYPDEAHFIYELLQNAEDTGATEVFFELNEHSCSFEHNGSRHFCEQDIRGITGIFNSTKADRPDKIGKFGVGFKSVFVYTNTPHIFSKNYSFRILNLVLPQEIPGEPSLGDNTKFIFPFDNPKKSRANAYEEINSGLRKLAPATLLYLSSIQRIVWKVDSVVGELTRHEFAGNRVGIVGSLNDSKVIETHWLRYSSPIEGFDSHFEGTSLVRPNVSVAFELELNNDKKYIHDDVPLSKQVRIRAADRGTVSVFFPAEKETSGLRFHIHAPFVPEISRASIKNTHENFMLFRQLAKLVARSLHEVRDAGLLSADFLGVLPNNDEVLGERYAEIRIAVLEEMRKEQLVPVHGGGYAPGRQLVQGKAVLRALLSHEDLAVLTERDDEPKWAVGVNQRNSNPDRLLSSLGLPYFDEEELQNFLENNLRDSSSPWKRVVFNEDVFGWLCAKPHSWVCELFSVLNKYCEDQDDFGWLSEVYFIPLSDGDYGMGGSTFFGSASSRPGKKFNFVSDNLLSEGKTLNIVSNARKFLENIGVRELSESDDILEMLRDSYKDAKNFPDDEEHLSHLRWMVESFYDSKLNVDEIKGFRFLKIDSDTYSWAAPVRVYVDSPYFETGLKYAFDSLDSENQKRWPLSSWYLGKGIDIEKFLTFVKRAGAIDELQNIYVESSCSSNPAWGYLLTASGGRAGNSINRDFALTVQAAELQKANSIDASLMLWNSLCALDSRRISVFKACYQLTEKGGPKYADSQLVYSLKQRAWIPQADGSFVKPEDANSDLLPKVFRYDPKLKWLQIVGFGSEIKRRELETAERAAQREEFGFETEEDLELAHEFTKLSREERRQFIQSLRHEKSSVELPIRTSRNPDMRGQRVADFAKNSPIKSAEVKPRSVQIGVNEAKVEAKLYLRDQYTNDSEQMVCQICQDELPFKLENGSYYFEAVEVLPKYEKRIREAYLALCPNHAAAYQYANSSQNEMLDLIETAFGCEVEVLLGGRVESVYFTEQHLADLKAALSAQTVENFPQD